MLWCVPCEGRGRDCGGVCLVKGEVVTVLVKGEVVSVVVCAL